MCVKFAKHLIKVGTFGKPQRQRKSAKTKAKSENKNQLIIYVQTTKNKAKHAGEPAPARRRRRRRCSICCSFRFVSFLVFGSRSLFKVALFREFAAYVAS